MIEPRILPRAEHAVSRKRIAEHALKVLYRLHNAGHLGYLVGGGVRDLLLDRTPKDFDVSTDARPGQIKRLFRNCFLVGRRFRLAHVRFGEDVVEVSTFRKTPPAGLADATPRRPGREKPPPTQDGEVAPSGDNTYGTPADDAERRDFTANALFYTIADFSVIDYVGGIEDIKARRLRIIGDPDVRFEEDPVRMLRAVRLAAKLDFQIDPATREGIARSRHKLPWCSLSRLGEEFMRLLDQGAAGTTFATLRDLDLLRPIVPRLAEGMETRDPVPYLEGLDRLVAEGQTVSRSLWYAALLVPRAEEWIEGDRTGDLVPRIQDLADGTAGEIPVPRAVRSRAVAVLAAQRRFRPPGRRGHRRGFSRRRFVRQEIFPEALMLYEARCRAQGLPLDGVAAWRAMAEELRDTPLEPPPPRPRKKRKRRRRRKRRGGGEEQGSRS